MRAVEGPARVLADDDRRLILEDQPELRYIPSPDGSVAFEGDFVFKLASGSPQRIATRIEFTVSYPDEEPRALHLGSRFAHDGNHHFYANGRCCLWLDVETRWKPADPQGSLKRFLDELKVFYLRQLMMEANPKLTWPGRARGHGFAGHIEHLQERLRMPLEKLPTMLRALEGGVNRNAPCPCGRRVRYRKCHRDVIVKFRRLADPRAQREVAQLLRRMKAAGASRPTHREAGSSVPPRRTPIPEPLESRSSLTPERPTIDVALAKVTGRAPSRVPA